MKPRLETWLTELGFHLPLPSYFLMLVVSITLATVTLIFYRRRYGLHERALYSFLCWAIPALFIGGKIVYWLQFPEAADRGRKFWLGGGAALYGGLLGVLVTGVLTSAYYRLRLRGYLDGLALALSLGLTSGRIGCFLAGCNHGRPTLLPWGVRFPAGSPAYVQQVRDGLLAVDSKLSLPVHPTQLYESAFGLLMFWLGIRLLGRRRYEGQVFLVLMGGYTLFRFFVEFLRADQGVSWVGRLSFAQEVSLILAVLLFGLWTVLRKRKPGVQLKS